MEKRQVESELTALKKDYYIAARSPPVVLPSSQHTVCRTCKGCVC